MEKCMNDQGPSERQGRGDNIGGICNKLESPLSRRMRDDFTARYKSMISMRTDCYDPSTSCIRVNLASGLRQRP